MSAQRVSSWGSTPTCIRAGQLERVETHCPFVGASAVSVMSDVELGNHWPAEATSAALGSHGNLPPAGCMCWLPSRTSLVGMRPEQASLSRASSDRPPFVGLGDKAGCLSKAARGYAERSPVEPANSGFPHPGLTVLLSLIEMTGDRGDDQPTAVRSKHHDADLSSERCERAKLSGRRRCRRVIRPHEPPWADHVGDSGSLSACT